MSEITNIANENTGNCTASDRLAAAMEAVLFASGSPLSAERLAEIFEAGEDEINSAAALLSERLGQDESGISLIKVDGAYQLCTKSIYAPEVRKALEIRKAPPLSKAALEVLAIIAYNQPVTRSFIEMVRGVDSSYIVASLTDKGLIAECGQLDAPGRPTLFGTTDSFLRCFGLESVADLPEAGFVKEKEAEEQKPEGAAETVGAASE